MNNSSIPPERAALVTTRWNRKHPQLLVPLEWVEELVVAQNGFRLAYRAGDPKRAFEMSLRLSEFARRLPAEVVRAVMEGGQAIVALHPGDDLDEEKI